MEIKEIVLTKNNSHPHDFREMTFKDYIIIQNAAQDTANKTGYPVYLVGSAQRKHLSRDIDLAIIVPSDEYIIKYIEGEEEITNPEYQASAFIANAWHIEFENTQALNGLIFDGYKIDFKICPDNWFQEKEKTLLAKPRSENK